MALMAYLKLVGEKQGEIKGSVTQKGREGMIGVIAYNHDVINLIDATTGMASGKRQHTPLVILKEIDQSTPLLMKALTTNEILKQVDLRFWTPQITTTTGIGAEVQHYTIQLQNAIIIERQQEMLNIRDATLVKYSEREFVSFRYQKIVWIWEQTKVSWEDTW